MVDTTQLHNCDSRKEENVKHDVAESQRKNRTTFKRADVGSSASQTNSRAHTNSVMATSMWFFIWLKIVVAIRITVSINRREYSIESCYTLYVRYAHIKRHSSILPASLGKAEVK